MPSVTYAERHNQTPYGECRYTECLYTECRGATIQKTLMDEIMGN